MKRYGFLFEKVCSIENLMLAHKNAKKGKSKYKEVQKVDAHEDFYIKNLQMMLLSGEFTTSEYRVFTKTDKGKERTIYALPYYPDRIVQHAILQVVEPVWKPTLISSTYQSIKGRGIHKAKYDIEKSLRKYQPKYYCQLDVQKFYPSINNNILKQVIRKKIKDNKLLTLLDNIIDSTEGVPIGNYVSQYFGNLYLSGLDHYCKEELRLKMYYRYCDDIVICFNTLEEARSVTLLVENYLEKMVLKIKESSKVALTTSGIDFVGYVIRGFYTLLRQGIAAKAMKTTAKDSLVSYNGWMSHCDCHNLTRYIHDHTI